MLVDAKLLKVPAELVSRLAELWGWSHNLP